MRNTLVSFAPALVDPFARTQRWPSRMHPRRDPEDHPEGGGGDPAPEGDPKPEPEGDPKPEPEKEPADVDWKKEARKHEARAKENAKAAEELEKIRAKNRTAEENATKAAEQAAKERDEAKAEAAIERAARKHGLTDDKDLEVLQGLPADKVEAVAKALAAGKKPAGKGAAPVGGSKGDKKPTDLASAVAGYYAQ